MLDLDEFDILLGIFKSWRDNNACCIGEHQLYSDAFFDVCVDFPGLGDALISMSEVGNRRYVSELHISLSCEGIAKIAVGELGKLERLECLSITANCYLNDEHDELVGRLPFEKLTALKSLQLNFFSLDYKFSEPKEWEIINIDGYPNEEYGRDMIETFPFHGLPADKLRGIGKLPCLETLHLAGVKSGVDSSIVSEICGLKTLKDLKLVNFDSESVAWLKPTEKQVLALLHVTSPLPRDIQGKILEEVSNHIPHPIRRSFKDEPQIIEEPGAYDLELFDNKFECECENRLIQARKIFPELQEFGAKYFVQEYRVSPFFKGFR